MYNVKNKYSVAVDSNALTYLVDVIGENYDPQNDVRRLSLEKLAILRIYFYTGEPYYVVPTVENEYKNIIEPSTRSIHQNVHGMLLFDYTFSIDENEIANRTNAYLVWHKRFDDCRIVAEAELAEIDMLLTCDETMLQHLKVRTKHITLLRPSELWELLNIPFGARPALAPHESNPLSRKTWWRIGKA